MSDRLASTLGASTCSRTPDQSALDATAVNTWSAFRHRRGSAKSVGQSHLVFNPRVQSIQFWLYLWWLWQSEPRSDRGIRALGKNEIIPTRHSTAVIHPQFIERKMNTRGPRPREREGRTFASATHHHCIQLGRL